MPCSSNPRSPSALLLSAALGGLLCAAATACSSSEPASRSRSDGGAVTSSVVDSTMTLEKMTADCDARGGTVETYAHCGGLNSCRGMSYDETTQVLTEHTCRGLNTCAGYGCVVPG